jgi:hypothetical protein
MSLAVKFPNEPNKIIDEEFFFFQKSRTASGYKQTLDLHKWITLRESIQKGDFIEIDVAPIPENRPHRAIEQLSNYLKILRLSPTDDSSVTCLVDVSILTSKIAKDTLLHTFPSIHVSQQGKTRKAILPCARRLVPLENNQITERIPDKAKKSLKESPTDIQGMFLKYLEYEEFHMDKAHYAHNPQLANHLKTQYTKRAQEIADAALKRKSSLLFTLDETQEMSLLGPYVTKWEYHGPLISSHISLFATLFPNIEILNLGNCTYVDSIIAELKSFKKLQELRLTCSDVTGKTFAHLPPTLKVLNCLGCKDLNEKELSWAKECSIESFCISSTLLDGSCFKTLPGSLKSIYCSNCKHLQDEALLGLQGCSLEKLNISNTLLKGTYFSFLPRSLKMVRCSNCKALTDDNFSGLEGFSSLVELDISDTLLKGTLFRSLPRSLKTLRCSSCQSLEDEALLGLQGCALEELYITVTSLKGTYFNKLPRSLKTLHCWGCKSLDDDALLRLEGCSLEELDISDTTLEGIHIAKFHKTLKNLSADGCHRLRATTILKLQESELQSLKIRRTDLMKFCDFFPKTLEMLFCTPNAFIDPARILFQIQRFQSLRYLFIETTTPLNPNHLLIPPTIKDFETANTLWSKQNGVFKGLYKYRPNMMNHL